MLHGDGRTVHLSLDQRIDLYLHGFFRASIKLLSDYVAGVVVAFYEALLISSRPPSRASPKIPPSSHLRRFFSALHLPRPPLWDDLKPLVRPLSFGNFARKEKKVKFHGKFVHASLFGVGAPEALVIGVVALLVFGPKGLAESKVLKPVHIEYFHSSHISQIDEEQFSKILRYIKSGINSGATLIDLRILKAVALEHPNDIDVAAESILVEILPSIATSHESSFALQDANEVVRVSTSDGKGKQPMFYEH
ncbi:hypothetical protein ZIOFF_060328 [Zingiber officinale]|uniref:Uncharacterized protein n=1 Tax=Zingiber officinale TaxID=94328 RepID=A0A8J5KHP4_ZINOF|nr:hypothetical protein ZIOFF_060328 [Zingiber officinale]